LKWFPQTIFEIPGYITKDAARSHGYTTHNPEVFGDPVSFKLVACRYQLFIYHDYLVFKLSNLTYFFLKRFISLVFVGVGS
jgi:hypothetical protein